MDSKYPQDKWPVKTNNLSEPKKNKSTHTLSANWDSDQMSDQMSGSYWGSCQSFHQSTKDLSRITYFNCNQKGHYATQCLKLSEGFNVFDDLSCNDPSCDDSNSKSDAPNLAV